MLTIEGITNIFFKVNPIVQSTALSFATKNAMSPEFGGQWGTEC